MSHICIIDVRSYDTTLHTMLLLPVFLPEPLSHVKKTIVFHTPARISVECSLFSQEWLGKKHWLPLPFGGCQTGLGLVLRSGATAARKTRGASPPTAIQGHTSRDIYTGTQSVYALSTEQMCYNLAFRPKQPQSHGQSQAGDEFSCTRRRVLPHGATLPDGSQAPSSAAP